MADPILDNIQLQLRSGQVLRPVPEAMTLYWRAATPSAAPGGTLSTRVGALAGALAAPGSLLPALGPSLAFGPTFTFPGSGPALSGNPAGVVPGQAFVSPALAPQVIPAQDWTLGGKGTKGTVADVRFAATLALWRPGTGATVLLYDGAAGLGGPWSLSCYRGAVGTFAGAGATAEAGDRLVLEVWLQAPGDLQGTKPSVQYDGPQAVTEGGGCFDGAQPASFLSSTYRLAFAP